MAANRAKCPQCGRAVAALPVQPWRPFCSERCRLLDLGAWLSERHAIAGEDAAPDAGEPPDSDQPR